jgi:hypothetical protein
VADGRDQFGDEVHRLVDAVQDWARRFPESRAEHAPRAGECLPWCPICQFANILRGEHPEVTERLTEAANAFAAAMKALADVALTRTPTQPRARPKPGQPGPRVERIRLDDVTGTGESDEV